MQHDDALAELEKLSLVHRVGQAAFLWFRTGKALRGLDDKSDQQGKLGGFVHGMCLAARLDAAETAAAAYVVGLLTGEDEDALAAARKTLCTDRRSRVFQQGVYEAIQLLERAGDS
jgi:hypothetical protein